MTEPLYIEDLFVGRKFTTGTYRMDEQKIKEFAAEFDPQPFHLDESAAQASVFKGLAASGWHTASVGMKLLVGGGLPFAGGIIGVGGELAWPRPTRPGDILQAECEVLSITPSRSKPQQGFAAVRIEMSNQNKEVVYTFTVKILVHKRPVG